MPPFDLAPLSQATTTSGPSLVPTDGPKGSVGQRDGASIEGSLAEQWGSGMSKILTIPTPTGSDVKWSFATNAPPAIETATWTQQSGEPTLAYEGDEGKSVPRPRRHPLERRVPSSDESSPRPTYKENVVTGVGFGGVVVLALGGFAWFCHTLAEDHLDRYAAVNRVTRTRKPFLPRSLHPSAIRKRLGFGPKVMGTTENGQELQPYPSSTADPNQQASQPPTDHHDERSPPISATARSRLSGFWPDARRFTAIRDKLGFGKGTKPAESVEARHALPASIMDANTQAPEPSIPQITRTSSFNTSRGSFDTVNGAMPVECRDFIA